MTPIEKAAKAAFEKDWPKDSWARLGPGYHQDRYVGITKAGITAFLDAVQNDPEAIDRARQYWRQVPVIDPVGGAVGHIIDALKQEAER